MNFTSSILKNSVNQQNPILTILVVDQEKEDFINFLKPLGHKFVYYSDLYFGGIVPNLILCNNKIDYYHQCKELSIRYHIPSIVVDHNVKSDIYDENKIKFLDNLPCSFKIATSIPVYRSWHSIHDKVLPYSNNDAKQLEPWSELFNAAIKKEFIL